MPVDGEQPGPFGDRNGGLKAMAMAQISETFRGEFALPDLDATTRLGGAVKASLRAKEPAHRVDLIAAQFNGGGHTCAAGLNLKVAPPDFRARLVAALERRLAAVDAAKKG